MSDVIDIGEVRLSKKYQKHCDHKKLVYDPVDKTIQCQDCERFIDPFSAFLQVVQNVGRAQERLNRLALEVKEAREKELSLLSAKKVEAAWRSRTMVPACPHCDEAIFADDGFGDAQVNKKMALDRRKFKKSRNS